MAVPAAQATFSRLARRRRHARELVNTTFPQPNSPIRGLSFLDQRRNTVDVTPGTLSVGPDPRAPIPKGAELILLGTWEGEKKLIQWSQE